MPLVPKLLFGHGRLRNSRFAPRRGRDAKRSFAERVPEPEFGNEEKSPARRRLSFP